MLPLTVSRPPLTTASRPTSMLPFTVDCAPLVWPSPTAMLWLSLNAQAGVNASSAAARTSNADVEGRERCRPGVNAM
jgi:hypothetical protein